MRVSFDGQSFSFVIYDKFLKSLAHSSLRPLGNLDVDVIYKFEIIEIGEIESVWTLYKYFHTLI